MTENFVQYLRYEKRYAEKTIEAYQNDIAQFSVFIQELGIEHFYLVKPPHIRLWIVSLVEAGVQAASLRRKISALNTFYKYSLRKGLAKTNPAHGVSLPRLPQRLPRYVEQKALNDLFNHEAVFSDDFSGERDRLIMELLYATGMRRQELTNLRWEDIDEANGQIKVLGKGNKERYIPVATGLICLLKKYRSHAGRHFNGTELPSQIVLTDKGQPAYPELIYKTAKKYLSLCSTQEKKSPHVLRHSFATHLTNNGAPLNDVKELLGHASLASTQVYTHNTIEQLKEIYKIAHPKA